MNILYTNELEKEIKSLRQQLADTIERQAAQIGLLRDFIENAPVASGVCCCGESMEGHSSPMSCGHSPVDMWDYSAANALSINPDQALERFAAKVREQCAKVCEIHAQGWEDNPGNNPLAGYIASSNCADAIRNLKELP